MSTNRKSFISLVFIVVILIACLQLGLNAALGLGLKELFSQGTGCNVRFESPWIHFFPFRGTIENVRIRHLEEKRSRGFFAKKVSVELELAKLLSKTVSLRHLRLEEAKAISKGPDSGFWRTIKFVTPHRSREANSNEKRQPTWHSFLTDGWSIALSDLVVFSDKRIGPHLELIGKRGRIAMSDLSLEMLEISNPLVDTAIVAKTKFLELEPRNQPASKFGETILDAGLNKGVLRVRRASLGKYSDQSSRPTNDYISIGGVINFNAGIANQYALDVSTLLPHKYLSNLIPGYGDSINNSEAAISANAKISGPLLEPKAVGSIELKLARPFGPIRRKECLPDFARSVFFIDSNRIKLENLQIADLAERGSVELTFDELMSFSAELSLALGRDNPLLKRCLDMSAQLATAEQPFDSSPTVEHISKTSALASALLDSSALIKASGSLKEPSISGSLTANIRQSDIMASSLLVANFNTREDRLNIEVAERGAMPQIQDDPVTSSRPPESSTTDATTFRTAINSKLTAFFSIGLKTGEFFAPNISFVRYPLEKLIAFFSPLLSQSQLATLTAVSTKNSLLSATLSDVRYQPAVPSLSGAGNLFLSDFSGLEDSFFETALSFSGKNIFAKNAIFRSQHGEVLGSGSVAIGGEIGAELSTRNFNLSSVPFWQKYLPSYPCSASVTATLSGTYHDPHYSVSVDLDQMPNTSPVIPVPKSHLEIEGNAILFKVKGDLFNKSALLNIQYPIMPQKAAKLELSLDFEQFPLYIFIASDTSSSANHDFNPLTMGVASGSLRYRGTTHAPLLGTGELLLSRFHLALDGNEITHDKPLRAAIENGRLTFADIDLLAANNKISISGYLDHRTGWDANIHANWNLAHFAALWPDLEQLAGNLNTRLNISGPVDTPVISGPLELAGATLSFPIGNSLLGATKINAKAIFAKQSLLLDELTARIGQGYVFGIGRIQNIFDASTRETDLHFKFSDILLEPIEKLTVNGTGILHVTQSAQRPPHLWGNFDIHNALYEDTVNLADVLKAISSKIAGATPVDVGTSAITAVTEGADDLMTLNIDLRADNALLVETNIARAEMRGDINLGGTTRQPRLDGQIETIDGQFGFRSNEFEIITGKMVFPKNQIAMDPNIDIIGETQVSSATGEDYQVQLAISGTLSSPTIRFSSDSGLGESDIVSLLAFGGRVEELSLLQIKSKTSQLSFAELLDPKSDLSLQDRLSGLTGLREVQLDSRSSIENGEFVPIITATRPVVDDLDLILKTELGREQVNSAQLKYSLTEYLSLISGWKSRAVTSPDSATGEFSGGVTYKRTFPGITFIPPQLSDSSEE